MQDNRRGRRAIEQLTASVPSILSAGRYDGKSKPHKERGDGFVAFHFFEKEVDVDSTIVTAGVNVGEREDKRFEYIAYGLNHSENAAWKKREASGGAGNEPASDASPGSVSASLDSILGDGGEGINIVILKVIDKETGKRLTELEDGIDEGSDASVDTSLARVESILSATDGAAKVRYEAGGKVYISVSGDGKQGEMRYVLFYYKGSAGEFLKSYRHGNGLLSDAFLANVQKVESAFSGAGIVVVDKEGNVTTEPSHPAANVDAKDANEQATDLDQFKVVGSDPVWGEIIEVPTVYGDLARVSKKQLAETSRSILATYTKDGKRKPGVGINRGNLLIGNAELTPGALLENEMRDSGNWDVARYPRSTDQELKLIGDGYLCVLVPHQQVDAGCRCRYWCRHR